MALGLKGFNRPNPKNAQKNIIDYESELVEKFADLNDEPAEDEDPNSH